MLKGGAVERELSRTFLMLDGIKRCVQQLGDLA